MRFCSENSVGFVGVRGNGSVNENGHSGGRSARIEALPDAIMILAGVVRKSALSGAARRSILDLPLGNGRSLIEHMDRALAGRGEQKLRIIVDSTSTLPRSGGERWSVEREPASLRGMGGMLRDTTAEYAEDAMIAVINGPQVFQPGLMDLISRMVIEAREKPADVVLAVDEANVLDGITLIRAGAIRALPAIGYVDLKEQALNSIIDKRRVGVVRTGGRVGMPVRTLSDYLQAVRVSQDPTAARQCPLEACDPEKLGSWSVVEAGARVSAEARLNDSVVLEGGVVEAGATVARSFVGPGGVVRAGTTVVDSIVREGRQS